MFRLCHILSSLEFTQLITWDYRFFCLYRGPWVIRLFSWVFLFVLMLCFTVCSRDWFIATGPVCPEFENDDDDGNASAIFLSPLGLCLYDNIYASLSSSGLISYSSLFCMLLFSMVYVDTLCFIFAFAICYYPLMFLCFS